MTLHLGTDALDRVMPFRVVCDGSLRIVGLGASLRAALGTDALGRAFSDLFTADGVSDGGRPAAGPPGASLRVRGPRGLRLEGTWVTAEADDGARLVFAATPVGHGDVAGAADGCAPPTHAPPGPPAAATEPTADELRARVRELEERVRCLDAAREAAERSDRAKNRHLASVSHELRTPLQVVLGFSQLLAEERLTAEDRRSHLEAVRANGEVLARLVDDLVDLARAEAGELALVNAPVHLDTLVGEVVRGQAPRARAKGLALRFRPCGLARPFTGDAVRLRQIVQNLVDNGIKYTPGGEVTVTVSAGPADDPELVATVAVEDTGIGVGDDAHLLFQPFSRLARGREQPGTGLGLALARGMARAAGGDLRYEPRSGGSRFLLEVRAPWAAAQPGPSVLLVGDNAALLRLARTFLERAGHTVEEVATGEQALAWLDAERRPAAVVIEGELADRRGAEVARRATRRGGPVVALPVPEDHRHALVAAGARPLEGPLRARALVSAVGGPGTAPRARGREPGKPPLSSSG